MCVFVSVYDRLKRSIWRSTHSFLIYVHSICMGFKQNQKIYIFTPTNAFNWILNSAGVRETRRSSNATWLEFNAIATLQLRYVRESEQSTLHTLHKSVIRNIPKYGNRIGERTFGVRMCAELLNVYSAIFRVHSFFPISMLLFFARKIIISKLALTSKWCEMFFRV